MIDFREDCDWFIEKVHGSFSTFEWTNKRRCCSILARPEHERGYTEPSENRSIRRSLSNRIYALLTFGENRLILLRFCASGLLSPPSCSPVVSFPFRFSWFLFAQTKGEFVRDCLRVKARLHWRFLLLF